MAKKYVEELFSSVLPGKGERYTRLRIIHEIMEFPLNALQTAKRLNLDYKTVTFNLKILEKKEKGGD